jgi:uncharacterized protein YecT (DUF1311 family)
VPAVALRFAVLVLASAPAGAIPSPCASASTTLAMTECLVEQVRKADATMDRYLRTAQGRLRQEHSEAAGLGGTAAAVDLGRSQRLWLAYRRSHCGDIAARWQEASVQPLMALDCQLRLSRERSRELWRAYLTYQDRTPPLLPDPGPVEAPLPPR